MSGGKQPPARDAFRDRLAEAQAATDRPELAHQSLGRPLDAAEDALARAMMDIYGAGATTLEEVARGLTARAVQAPISGRTDWDAELLHEELRAANQSLDAAYQENGYGA
jgi:hypothetical protein